MPTLLTFAFPLLVLGLIEFIERLRRLHVDTRNRRYFRVRKARDKAAKERGATHLSKAI